MDARIEIHGRSVWVCGMYLSYGFGNYGSEWLDQVIATGNISDVMVIQRMSSGIIGSEILSARALH